MSKQNERKKPKKAKTLKQNAVDITKMHDGGTAPNKKKGIYNQSP